MLKIVEMWEKVDVSKIFCIEERFFFQNEGNVHGFVCDNRKEGTNTLAFHIFEHGAGWNAESFAK